MKRCYIILNWDGLARRRFDCRRPIPIITYDRTTTLNHTILSGDRRGTRNRPRFILSALLAAATLACCAAPCWARTSGCCSLNRCGPPREVDDVWLINSRGLGSPSCEPADVPNLKVRHYVPGRGWQSSTAAQFFQSDDPQAITCFYFHGYRNDPATAVRMGWSFYHATVDGLPEDRPVRFVIWSWPSTQVYRLLQDARVKAQRTDTDAYYLGWVLSKVDPDVQVSLVGWSLGARIITGAMHLLGGGELCGWVLPDRSPSATRRLRVVLMGATLHDDWLLPGRYHGQAVSQIDRMLLLNNSCDPILKRYRFISRCERPEALGYSGMACPGQLGDALQRIRQQDVCCIVGNEHDSTRYFCSAFLMATVRRYASYEPL